MNKSMYKDYSDINFWNYKKIIETIERDNINELKKLFQGVYFIKK